MFCELLLQLSFLLPLDVSVWFSSCALGVTASFCFFLIFFSCTFFIIFFFPFLYPNLNFLFFLTITKSQALVILLSSDSPFTSFPSILLSYYSTFNLRNIFFSLWSLILIVVLLSIAHSWIIGITSNMNVCVWGPSMSKILLVR